MISDTCRATGEIPDVREYSSMSEEFGFRVLDARRPIDVIQDDLRRQVQAFLSNSDIGVEVPGMDAARS